MHTGKEPGRRSTNESITRPSTGPLTGIRPRAISLSRSHLRFTTLLLAVAVLGSLIMTVSDALLLGNPVSGMQAFLRDARNMLAVSDERLVWGGMLGVLTGGPLQVAGYVALYRLTRTAGGYQPLVMSSVFIYMVVMAVAAHMAYINTGIALRTDIITGDAAGVQLISAQQNILRIVLMIFNGAPLVLGSVMYMMLIMKGPTTLPRKMALVNPLTMLAAVAAIALLAPSPVGGYLALPSFSLAQLIFFSALLIHVRGLRPGILSNTKIS